MTQILIRFGHGLPPIYTLFDRLFTILPDVIRQPRLPVDVVMGIALEDDNEDFIKTQQEVFRTAYGITSRKLREAGQKQKKNYDKG